MKFNCRCTSKCQSQEVSIKNEVRNIYQDSLTLIQSFSTANPNFHLRSPKPDRHIVTKEARKTYELLEAQATAIVAF
jgi:hypothetical protein